MTKSFSYTDRIAARHKARRLAAKPVEAETPVAADAPTETVATLDLGFVHPMRYPKHADPAKGQVFDGVCNTTRCDNTGSQYFNRGTYGLYCIRCARGQNDMDPVPVSVRVERKPSAEQMDVMRREMTDAMSEHRRLTA
ncbi:hypothetical protein ACOI1H_13565 [Loktanella sp. DJP18]|uniref:hypothetical protein n=1 Tax=Loktanella sp. DJP18 TaxID=3409788 RepID=UPI003BB72640